jgi:hypothetical protein
MKNEKSLAEILGLDTVRDTGVVLRVPEEEKNHIQALASDRNLTVSDFIRQAIYYYTWATSELELKVHDVNQSPEYIDLINTAQYDIYLANYLITDDTFDTHGTRTNVHQHSFHFGPLLFQTMTGQLELSILRAGQIVRVYSGAMPSAPPAGISIWTYLPGKIKIWNNGFERVTIHRIAKQDSEDIIAGIPLRKLRGLQSILERKSHPKLSDSLRKGK